MPRIWSWSGYSSQNQRTTDPTKDQFPVPSSSNTSSSISKQQQQQLYSEPSIKLPTVATLTEYSCEQSNDGPGEAAICSYESGELDQATDQSIENKGDSLASKLTAKGDVHSGEKDQEDIRHQLSPSESVQNVKLISPSPVTRRKRQINQENFMQLDHQSAFMSSNFTERTSSSSNDRTNNNVQGSLNKSIWTGSNLNPQEVTMSSKHEVHSGKNLVKLYFIFGLLDVTERERD